VTRRPASARSKSPKRKPATKTAEARAKATVPTKKLQVSDPSREGLYGASAFAARGMPPIPLPEVYTRKGNTVFHVMVDEAVLATHANILKSRAPLFSQFPAMEVKKSKYIGPGSYGALYKGTVCRQEARPACRLPRG